MRWWYLGASASTGDNVSWSSLGNWFFGWPTQYKRNRSGCHNCKGCGCVSVSEAHLVLWRTSMSFHAVEVGQAQIDNRKIRLVRGSVDFAASCSFRFHYLVALGGQR